MIINRVDFNRKVLAMLLICTLMTSILFPNRSHALAPAIPIAAVGGVVLMIGGVAVIASELGYTQQSDDMKLFADMLWAGATAEVKGALESAYNAAAAAGDKMMSLPSSVGDYIKSKIASLAGVALTTRYTSTRGDYFSRTEYGTHFKMLASSPAGYMYLFTFGNGLSGFSYVVNAEAAKANTNTTFFATDAITNQTHYFSDTNSLLNKDTPVYSALGVMLSSIGGGVVITDANFQLLKNKVNALKSAVPASIPVPMAKDFIVVGADDAKPIKTPLVIQPDNTWKNAETGKVYNPADTKVQSYPKVKTVTDAKTGTTVGTVVQDGVDVNVRTGEKVGDVTANPPLDLNPPSGSINWGPLKAVGSLFTTKFPFSIPWDIARQLSIFNVKPQTPVFDVDIAKFFDYGGTKFGMKFHVDLSAFDTIAVIARWASTIVFDIGLILSIRKFMPE